MVQQEKETPSDNRKTITNKYEQFGVMNLEEETTTK